MENFWKNKSVFVTGAGGFIGSHLVETLVEKGAQVRSFVRYNSRSDPGLLKLLAPGAISKIKVIRGDLRDLPALNESINGAEFVIHLGALISIPYSYSHPRDVVECNVIGTLNVLQACRQNNVKRLVHTSSSEVYGTALKVPIDETHPLQGQSPYSASKIGADKLVESFQLSYGLPAVTVRPFNTYGPRQSTRAVIPAIITQALTQSRIGLGNLDASRDFTYVSDTVEAILKATQVPDLEGKILNLGTGNEIRIGDLANEIIKMVGRKVEIVIDSDRLRPDNSEVQRLVSDNRQAVEYLDWKPKTNLNSGLLETIDWYKNNIDLFQANRYFI